MGEGTVGDDVFVPGKPTDSPTEIVPLINK